MFRYLRVGKEVRRGDKWMDRWADGQMEEWIDRHRDKYMVYYFSE